MRDFTHTTHQYFTYVFDLLLLLLRDERLELRPDSSPESKTFLWRVPSCLPLCAL